MMGEHSKIEWTDHTFNPWWGCEKVSAACANCYAEALDKRTGGEHWGRDAPRRMLSEANWAKPVAWNRKAKEAGVRARVFCASMADVFEQRPDVLDARLRLWGLISKTPNLDWLLLSKRPENFRSMLPWTQGAGYGFPPWRNVWLGVTAEDQRRADERIPILIQTPAVCRFVSVEPLLGPVSLGLMGTVPETWGLGYTPIAAHLHWVIVGGESGSGARLMRPEWAQALRDECRESPLDGGTPFFFKQWGDVVAPDHPNAPENVRSGSLTAQFVRIGKKRAGRELDGQTYNGLPEVACLEH